MPGLLGVRLRGPVLPTMFDFAVAAAVVLTHKLQEPAPAASGQMKNDCGRVRLDGHRRGMSLREKIPPGRRTLLRPPEARQLAARLYKPLEVNRSGPIQRDEPCREASHTQGKTGLDCPVILSCRWFVKNRHRGSMSRLESESS
jgi:hypothetical protein